MGINTRKVYLILGVTKSNLRSSPIDGTNYNGSVKVYEKNLNSFEQIGQTIYGNDEYDFLGDHSSLSENGNVLAVALRSNK